MSNELDDLKAENKLLRRMLALRVAGAGLYMDDGEMSDSTVDPAIDFKRDSVGAIEGKLQIRGLKTFERQINGLEVHIDYTNWENKRGLRRVRPIRLRRGTQPPYHMEPGWLLEAYDLDKSADRVFALNKIHYWSGAITILSDLIEAGVDLPYC